VKMKWERKERKKFLLSLIPSQVGVFPARNRENEESTGLRGHDRPATFQKTTETETATEARTTGPG